MFLVRLKVYYVSYHYIYNLRLFKQISGVKMPICVLVNWQNEDQLTYNIVFHEFAYIPSKVTLLSQRLNAFFKRSEQSFWDF